MSWNPFLGIEKGTRNRRFREPVSLLEAAYSTHQAIEDGRAERRRPKRQAAPHPNRQTGPTNGTWHYQRSSLQLAANAPSAASIAGFSWGLPGDIPQPADYDGDKRTDFAVFRPATGVWYLSNSNNGTYNTFSAPNWGIATDEPATSHYRITNPKCKTEEDV